MQVLQAGPHKLLLLELDREFIENIARQAGFEFRFEEESRRVLLDLNAESRQAPLLLFDAADPANLVAAAARLASATGVQGMVGGQYIDVSGTAPGGADGLRRLHELKTGRLIGASIECVLLLDAGCDAAQIAAFRDFAGDLGVLFQIVDDILDVTGSSRELGKQEGADERLGKRTYVTEFGLDGARRLADECHGRARGALADAAPGGAEELERITDFIARRSY